MMDENFVLFCHWKSLKFMEKKWENTCIKMQFLNGKFCSVPQVTGVCQNKCVIVEY